VHHFIGCAGWAIPSAHSSLFVGDGSHLVRYASRFNAVEINSSFYRPHQKKTYRRWAQIVPAHFRFSVKVPKQITHERRLVDVEGQLDEFLESVQELNGQLGPLLVQLPPSLSFSATTAVAFFSRVRERIATPIVCEPRHKSWFTAEADDVLLETQVGRVAADPAVVPQAAEPGGSLNVVYFRLHGSPHMYYSSYSEARLVDTLRRLRQFTAPSTTAWCIFDNTAAGAAAVNAMTLSEMAQNASMDAINGDRPLP
jgi:uncharacterized protein YecE (DUF72 family)